jgi:hypothetical protein
MVREKCSCCNVAFSKKLEEFLTTWSANKLPFHTSHSRKQSYWRTWKPLWRPVVPCKFQALFPRRPTWRTPFSVSALNKYRQFVVPLPRANFYRVPPLNWHHFSLLKFSGSSFLSLALSFTPWNYSYFNRIQNRLNIVPEVPLPPQEIKELPQLSILSSSSVLKGAKIMTSLLTVSYSKSPGCQGEAFCTPPILKPA